MKRTARDNATVTRDELRPEYRFDYSMAKPNRFASKLDKSSLLVVLDEDIARVFRTPESVKAVLRALIATMPEPASDRARRRTKA